MKHILLALVLLFGVTGVVVAEDFEAGKDAFTRQDFAKLMNAAEAGYTEAQYAVGLMYAEGDGVPEDDQKAVRWLGSAAEAGHPEAQFILGAMYILGEGVPQDYVQAHRWFNIAAANITRKETRARAVSYRDCAARKMSTHQITEAQKLAREWKPVK